MKKFETFTGTICAVDRANIDTDALIPKEHLKSIKNYWIKNPCEEWFFGPGITCPYGKSSSSWD